MVFHALDRNWVRRLLACVRQIPERYLGAVANWADLEQIFQDAAGRNLRWFLPSGLNGRRTGRGGSGCPCAAVPWPIGRAEWS